MEDVLDRRWSLTIEGREAREKVNHVDEFVEFVRGYFVVDEGNNRHQEINFRQLIDEAMAVAKHHTILPKLDINISINQQSLFHSDELRTSLILKHLIGNAIRFQDENKAENIIDIEVHINRIEATIEIVDNGRGIPKKQQKDIFKVFFKATETSAGFGVGLYVVEKCLDHLNGYININSSHGIGTHCILKIPNTFRKKHK